MRIVWTGAAWERYVSWEERRIVRRINALIRDIQRGASTRNIAWCTGVRDGDIEIIACRRHYEK